MGCGRFFFRYCQMGTRKGNCYSIHQYLLYYGRTLKPDAAWLSYMFVFYCFRTFQAARVQSDQAGNTCQQLLNGNNIQSLAEQSSKEIQTSMTPASFIPGGDREQSAPLMYTPQGLFPQKSGHIEEDPRKSAAAAVAAKLTASTSSAQMLSYVLSSLASEGVIGNPMTESSGEYHSEKRAKLDNDQSSYTPSQNHPQQQHQQLPPFSIPEPTTNQQSTPNEPPPPPSSSPPPLPPLPPMPQQYPVPQFMQTAGSINNMAAYSYGMTQQPPMGAAYPAAVGASLNNVSPFAPPMNPYQSFQGSDGNYYNQPSSMPMAPISRQ